MSTLKLTYFDTTGGRGEALRIILHAGNIAFEDHRISFAEFGQMVSGFPLGAVPVAEIGGTTYTQSNALLRYYGSLTGFYPEDAWEAFKCDELMGATEDVTNKLVATFGLKDKALVEARGKWVEGPATRYINLVNKRLAAAGGNYLADNRLTVADLKVFIQLRAFPSGFLDHVPTDLLSKVAPAVEQYRQRIEQESVVTNYYAK